MTTALQKQISVGIRSARLQRRVTQVELAKKLGISQSRLSEIEQGQGSITAEQFIFLLQFFNLPISHFVKQENVGVEDQLQNRLIQLGATHLREVIGILPSEGLNDVSVVMVESLAGGFTSRLLMALVPAFVKNNNHANLQIVETKLKELELVGRLYWFVEGTYLAIEKRLQLFVPREYQSIYKKTANKLGLLQLIYKDQSGREDILDNNITSQKTLDHVRIARDDLARKWNIVTRITQMDFDRALLEMEKP